MSRSPLSYPLNRHADMDAGGAADLQTDVMRFMAIISLCLVAIFALVQSLPTATLPLPDPAVEQPPAAATMNETTLESNFEPDINSPLESNLNESVDAPTSTANPKPIVAQLSPAEPPPAVTSAERKPLHRPLPELLPPLPDARPDTATSPPLASSASPPPRKAAAAPAQQDGFSLRFESDRALKRLVASKDIGLYALDQGKALRMTVNGAALSFWPASSPRQIYEMDESTVPADVVRALRSSAVTADVQWGVTLPHSMTRDLDRYLTERTGGALVIQSGGRLVLEE